MRHFSFNERKPGMKREYEKTLNELSVTQCITIIDAYLALSKCVIFCIESDAVMRWLLRLPFKYRADRVGEPFERISLEGCGPTMSQLEKK